MARMTNRQTMVTMILSCQIAVQATCAQTPVAPQYFEEVIGENTKQSTEEIRLAIAKLQDQLQLWPEDDFLRYQIGNGYKQLGDLKRAQDCYAEALRLLQYRAYDKFRSISQYRRAFKTVQTLRAHKALVAGYEASVDSSTRKADLDNAIERYKESLSILDSPTGWFYLGAAYEKKRMLTEALEAYKNATGKAELPLKGKPIELLNGVLIDERGKMIAPDKTLPQT